MSFTVSGRRTLPACATALAAAALLSGATAAHAAEPSAGCPSAPLAQPFAPWQDTGDYVMAPDGDVEAGASTWSLAGGAGAVAGNEPFHVGGADDATSLRLPAGSSATTAPMCIAPEHRTMRFFARGSGAARLKVEAVYTRADGQVKHVRLGVVAPTDEWAPTAALPMVVNEDAAEQGGSLSVSLRFSARGTGDAQIDDVYVDPYRTR